jgi:radical SAM protein with 4Fe4S-binding SPASM domain
LSVEEFREEILLAGRLQKDLHPVIAPVGLPEYWALHNVKRNSGRMSSVLRGCIGGNLREKSPEQIWSGSELFRDLRNRDNLKGICHDCSQREMCGGCRARAFGKTGDLFAEDHMCPLDAQERSGIRH